MDWYDHGGWGAGWLVMVVLMVAMVVAVVIALVWTARSLGASGSPTSADDPERILEARFARGEIDAEEFRTRRELLRKR